VRSLKVEARRKEMTEKELRERWSCTTRQLNHLCEKGILSPMQDWERGRRNFDEKEVDEAEKRHNIITDYMTIPEFAKLHKKSYMTIRNWIADGRLKACTLFKPIRIPK
jgi:hypothetical protein